MWKFFRQSFLLKRTQHLWLGIFFIVLSSQILRYLLSHGLELVHNIDRGIVFSVLSIFPNRRRRSKNVFLVDDSLDVLFI